MNLSQIAYLYRPVVYTMTVVLMVYGIFSYFSLPTREDPDVTIREAVVTTHYPGLSAERMELLVTKTLEEAIRQMPEVEEIRSTSMAGVSIIHVEAHDRYFDLDQIWDDLRTRVSEAQANLPEGASTPVVNDDFGDVAVVTAALTSADFTMAEMFDMAQHVRDTLYTVDGTKRVDILGAQQERIYVEVQNARRTELGISQKILQDTLAQQNVIHPGGEIDTGVRAFIIEPSGNYRTVEEIGETLIRLPDTGGVVPLRDLATIRRGYIDPPRQKAYYNGEPAILLAIAMLPDYSVLDYGARVKAALGTLGEALPVGYQLDIVTYQATQVAGAVYGVTANVLQTLGIVLGVVILFLGLRTGLIVGSIVPAVMLVTLAVMGFFDMTLQRMSLATLVIALGLLVDNGIVIAEDFKRRLEGGADRDAALRETGGELAIPLLSSTLTTILVFLPLMLAEHVAGEYTRSISIVILITLLTSWLLAMMLTPSLCHRFIKIDPENAGNRSSAHTAPDRRGGQGISQRLFTAMNAGYERILIRILRRRWLFMGGMAALLAASIAAMSVVPQKFFPDSDRAQVLVYLDMPAGVSANAMDLRMQEVFAALQNPIRFPHIVSHVGYVGFGGPRFVLSLTPVDSAPHRGFMVLNIDDFTALETTVTALRQMFHESFPGLDARVTGMFLGPSDSTKVDIQVRGPDADFLYRTAEAIEAIFARLPGAIDIRHDWENRIAKIAVRVDQARARRAGITSADIADSMASYFSGQQISEFREGDDIFPIIARAEGQERTDLDRVKTLNIFTRDTGVSVPLVQVADFDLENGFSHIQRENMVRTITIEARNTHMTAEDMVPLVQDDLNRLRATLPPGHSIEFDGVVTQSAEARQALAANIPLCIGAVLILLVTQFNSFKRPAIIVMTIPLLLIGAVLGLFTMQANFGFMVILGLYSLAGIIINNAIVLIDRIDIERREGGKDAHTAIITASVRRLRPIIMTTVTTILGLLPLILFQDALFYGMACVIAFGLLVGTVLTLGVVPILYSLFFGITPAQIQRPAGMANNPTPALK